MNQKTIALVLGTLMALVAVVGLVSDDADASNVNSYAQINQALAGNDEAVLQSDIVLENGQAITVPEDSTAVLDLNGHKITVSDDFQGWAVVNYGTLAITGNGTIDVSGSFDGYGAVRNFGHLDIENGTFDGKTEAGYYAKPYVDDIGGLIRNEETGNLVIYGGTYHGTPRALHNLGTAYVNGGTFSGDSCYSCTFHGKDGETFSQYSSYTIGNNSDMSYMVFNNGTVTGVHGGISGAYGYIEINGGNFSTHKCQNGHSPFHACYIAGDSGDVSGVINGGNFYSPTNRALWIGNSVEGDGGVMADAAVLVTGGVFKTAAGVLPVMIDTGVGVATIAGGSFFTDASSADAVGTPCTQISVRDDSGSSTVSMSDYFPEDSDVTIDPVTGAVSHTHVESDKYDYDENYHWHVCKYCDMQMSASEAHDFMSPQLVEIYDQQYQAYECADCGYIYVEPYTPSVIIPDDDEYIPPYVPSQPTDTGGDDDSVTTVACAAAAVVAALMAAFLILDRKR